jgi:thymidine kinase
MNECGYLEMFVGPMWSGKTSELLKIHKRYTFCEATIVSINYISDTRYGENIISSHDNIAIPCKSVKRLSEFSDIEYGSSSLEFTEASIILINEAQFFDDIVGWVKCAVERYHKKIYLCGLDGDYKREQFGELLDLIPFCDKITKLQSICGVCKNKDAIFTKRISHADEQELIGTEEYIPVCRKCYHNSEPI